MTDVRGRHRAEGDLYPRARDADDVARVLDTAIDVAAHAGAVHAAANAKLARQMAGLAEITRVAGDQARGALEASTTLLDSNITLTRDLAAAKLDAATQRGEQEAQRNPVSRPLLNNPLLQVAPIDVLKGHDNVARIAVHESVAAAAINAAARCAAVATSAAAAGSAELRAMNATLQQRAIDAEAQQAATEEAAYGQQEEVLVLLRTIDRFGKLAKDAAPLRDENRRLKAQLRAFEAKMTPAQIAHAVLPPGYTPPQSFRAFPGSANPLLKKAAPSLFAIRLMDQRELTLGDVVGEWVEMGDAVAAHRQGLLQLEDALAGQRRKQGELELTIVDERARRIHAEQTFHKLMIRRADASTHYELDTYKIKLAAALDEKVALAIKADRLERHIEASAHQLRDKDAEIARLSAALDPESAAQDIGVLRLHYQRDRDRLEGECTRLRSGWATTLEHAEKLDGRVKGAEQAAAQCATAARKCADAANAAKKELQTVAADLTKSRQRSAQLERELSQAQFSIARLRETSATGGTAHLPGAQERPARGSIVEKLMKDVTDTLSALQDCNASVQQLVLESTRDVNDEVDSIKREQDTHAMKALLENVARGVQSAQVDTGRARAAVLEELAVAEARGVQLQEALESMSEENRGLQEQLAEAQALVERVAVPVAETVLGHAVPDTEVHCAFCERERLAAEASAAREAEASAVAAALQRRLDELQTEAQEAVTREQHTAIRLRAATRVADRLQGELQSSRAEAAALDSLRAELQSAVQRHPRDGDDGDTIRDAAGEGAATSHDEDASIAAGSGAPSATAAESLQRLLDTLLEAAVSAQRSEAVANEATARVMATIDRATALSGKPTHGGEDDDATSADAGPEVAERVDRQSLVHTVKTIWELAMRCREREVAAVQEPVVLQTPQRLAAPTARADAADASSSLVPAVAAVDTALVQELDDTRGRVVALEGERSALQEQLAKSEKTVDTQKQLINFYKTKISQLEGK
jgi:hypothetical protein